VAVVPATCFSEVENKTVIKKEIKKMRFKGTKVLVTGGAGFIGSNVVEKLLKEGAKVTVLDDLFTGKLDNLPRSKSLKFVKGSVTNRSLVFKLVQKAQLVIHLAARNIIVSTKNPLEDFRVNIGGTLNLLLAARESNIKRFVYASSCSVYGNPRYLPINENDALNILTPYASSKVGGENYCVAFYETYDIPISIVRYSNVYGPKQTTANPYCGVIAKFIEAVCNNQRPTIHGDGSQTRDFTYIDDVVEATLLASIMKRAEGEVFNVGTGIETDINELADNIIRLIGKNLLPIHIEKRDIDNIRRRVMNIEKIRKRLRWVPEVTLYKGLKETIAWYAKTNENKKAR